MVPSTAERLASLQERHGRWVEEMREGRRLAEIDGTRGRVCDKDVKETERRYGGRVWKEDQGRCMTENDITSTKIHGT